MIRLQKFGEQDYDHLISWIDSEELLVQIAGRQMSFPVTRAQLDESQADIKRHAFSIVYEETGDIIGHCELYVMDNSAKIDRVIIGDKRMKGKGLCKPLIRLLLQYGFEKLDQPVIELNVFDWNQSAIRCYENAGLIRNPGKTMEFDMNGQKWITLNMVIDKQTYKRQKQLATPGSDSLSG